MSGTYASYRREIPVQRYAILPEIPSSMCPNVLWEIPCESTTYMYAFADENHG